MVYGDYRTIESEPRVSLHCAADLRDFVPLVLPSFWRCPMKFAPLMTPDES